MTERAGSRARLDELVISLYSTLREAAGRRLHEHAGRRSISPTELVHECYVKLARARSVDGLSATEFIALASRAIRNVLVDRVREQQAQKRGGGLRRVTLDGDKLALAREVDLLRLDVALQKLALIDERQARVVEMRFFGGLKHADIAGVLGVSPRTVNTDWAMARAWLHRELERG